MKKWFRWKGLIVFVVAVVVIVLAWLLLVDTAVRRAIEIAGTRVVGARVDLAKADLSLFPIGLSLRGLAVTNPDAPMQNAVEIAYMKMDLDTSYLIRRKVIINELVMQGLRFNTARRRSGAIAGGEAEKKAEQEKKVGSDGKAKRAAEKLCGEFRMPSLSQPDVSAILARESLTSLAMANDLDAKLKADRANWEQELQQLPDEKKLRGYQKQIEELSKGGGSLGALLGSGGKALQLREDIQKDLDRLQRARNTFTKDYKSYEQQVNALAEAPARDIERLMNQYGLSPKGLANLSQLIFGEQLCGWIQSAATWYGKVKPYVVKASGPKEGAAEVRKPLRGKGQNIRFAETPPMPDFLIRHLNLNADLAIGSLTGKVDNITADQPVLGRPMAFAFLGRQMKQINTFNLNGTADYVIPGNPKNNARLDVKGVAIKDLALVRESTLPLTLQKAAGDLNLKLNMAGDRLDALLKASFTGVAFVTGAGESSTAIGKAISSALEGVKRFSLNADIAGTLEAYTVNLSSDLDQVLKSAVGNLVNKEAARMKSELQQQIGAQLNGPLAQTRTGLAGLGGIDTELGKRLNIGNDLLKDVKLF